MTNYEKIKSMSLEEIVQFMNDLYDDPCEYCVTQYPCPIEDTTCCTRGHKLWLESESE